MDQCFLVASELNDEKVFESILMLMSHEPKDGGLFEGCGDDPDDRLAKRLAERTAADCLVRFLLKKDGVNDFVSSFCWGDRIK